jgi:hypothetical protein
MYAAPPTLDLSPGDSRLLADLRSLERLVDGPCVSGGGRLEQALGPELTGKLLFALSGAARCVATGEAAA